MFSSCRKQNLTRGECRNSGGCSGCQTCWTKLLGGGGGRLLCYGGGGVDVCLRHLSKYYIWYFYGTYVCTGNTWDLRYCRKKSSESLQDNIRRFPCKCYELPDAKAIMVFHSGTTIMSLVHKLVLKNLRTTKELLNIVTSHASGEEEVGVVFNHIRDVKNKRSEEACEGVFYKGASDCSHNDGNPVMERWPPQTARVPRSPSGKPPMGSRRSGTGPA